MAMAAAPAALSPGTVPLGVLLRREVTKERMERPDVLCGEANRSRKGEDFTLLRADAGQRIPGDPSTSFSVFAVINPHCSLLSMSSRFWEVEIAFAYWS